MLYVRYRQVIPEAMMSTLCILKKIKIKIKTTKVAQNLQTFLVPKRKCPGHFEGQWVSSTYIQSNGR